MMLAKMFLNPTIVTRNEWGARKPVREMEPMKKEVSHIVAAFTDTPECKTKQECVKAVREIQKTHTEKEGKADIQYNFLVGGDGNVYEGRGWKAAPDYPTKKEFDVLRGDALEVAFIGQGEKPSFKMLKAFAGILFKGIGEQAIIKDLRKLKPCLHYQGKVQFLTKQMQEELKKIQKKEGSEAAMTLESLGL